MTSTSPIDIKQQLIEVIEEGKSTTDPVKFSQLKQISQELSKQLHESKGTYPKDCLKNLLKTDPDKVTMLINKMFADYPVKPILLDKPTDSEIYDDLKQWVETHPVPTPSSTIAKYRIKSRVKQFDRIFRTVSYRPKNLTYLDYGAGDGSMALGIGTEFQFKRPIYTTDINQWQGIEREEIDTPDYVFKVIDPNGKIPFAQSFDCISVLMVLHHIENYKDSIRDIVSHLNPSGIVIIREHDVNDEAVQNLIHVEHRIYNMLNEKQTMDEFVKDYYGLYRSLDEWKKEFEDQWLKCIYRGTSDGPTRYAYLALQKKS